MTAMIRIAVTAEAFDAIAKNLPLGSVAYEGQPNEKGEWVVFLDDRMADKLWVMHQPGEGYSEVILRIAERFASAAAGHKKQKIRGRAPSR
jgi:hypothetical protein